MFKILVSKSNFFSIIFFTICCVGIFFLHTDIPSISLHEWIAMAIAMMAFFLNIYNLKHSILLEYINYNIVILLAFIWIGSDFLKDIEYSIAFLCVSLVNLLVNFETENKIQNFFIYSAILLFVANLLFYPSIAFTLLILVSSLFSGKAGKGFIHFLGALFMCIFFTIQVLYLTDNLGLIEVYFSQFYASIPSWSNSYFYLIPAGIFITLALIDHSVNSIKQSLLKRALYNLEIFLFVLLSLELIFFVDEFHELLLYLYFPIGVFYGRYTFYIKNPYLQNFVMILTILALICIRIFDFRLF